MGAVSRLIRITVKWLWVIVNKSCKLSTTDFRSMTSCPSSLKIKKYAAIISDYHNNISQSPMQDQSINLQDSKITSWIKSHLRKRCVRATDWCVALWIGIQWLKSVYASCTHISTKSLQGIKRMAGFPQVNLRTQSICRQPRMVVDTKWCHNLGSRCSQSAVGSIKGTIE